MIYEYANRNTLLCYWIFLLKLLYNFVKCVMIVVLQEVLNKVTKHN